MNLPDLKALDKIIALCRKRGVKEIQIGDVRIALGDEIPQSAYKAKKEASLPIADPLSDPEALTEEQALFYSVQSAEGSN